MIDVRREWRTLANYSSLRAIYRGQAPSRLLPHSRGVSPLRRIDSLSLKLSAIVPAMDPGYRPCRSCPHGLVRWIGVQLCAERQALRCLSGDAWLGVRDGGGVPS